MLKRICRWLSMAGLALCAAGLVPAPAQAQPKPDKIVVTAYGGIWTESVKRDFIPCFEKKNPGVKVEILTGESANWLNRVRANPNTPTINVITLSEADSLRAAREELFEKMTPAKMPYLKDIPEAFHKPWNDYSVAMNMAAMGVMYNKDTVKNPPATWKELIDNIAAGKYGNKVSWPSGTYTWGPEFIWFVAQQYGGSIDTAFQKLKAMQPHVLKFWNTPVEALNLFGTKEVDLVVYWDGRSHAFINKGNPWAGFYIPQPGTIPGSTMISVVKNSPEVTWDYVNCVLSPEGQLAHAKTVRYAITNQSVVYPPELKAEVIPFDKVVVPPYNEILDKVPGWIARWNQEIR